MIWLLRGGGSLKKYRKKHSCKLALFAAAVLIIIYSGCSKGPLSVESLATGSELDILHGTIEKSSLDFLFNQPKKAKTSADIFNFIYFEGDTICFSYTLSRRLFKKQAAVRFINPETGEAFPAERLEVYRYRVFGFSLVGSILEKFHKKGLQRPAPEDRYCCRPIPFIIEARFRDGEETITHRHQGTFKITYQKKP